MTSTAEHRDDADTEERSLTSASCGDLSVRDEVDERNGERSSSHWIPFNVADL